TISIISSITNTVLESLAAGSGPVSMSYNPANQNIYVVDSGSNIVTVISTLNYRTNSTIFVGLDPISIAYDSVNNNIYVVNTQSGTVSILSPGKYMAYKVTFTESGLPQGKKWYLNITGAVNSTASGPLINTTYSLILINGTYSYITATNDTKYEPDQSNGMFMVNGASLTIPVNYSKIPPPPPTPLYVYLISAFIILVIVIAILIPRSDFKKKL
ncbi:MAG: hypothetical protein QXQ25_03300, partial [Thermoplasmata archaeon]